MLLTTWHRAIYSVDCFKTAGLCCIYKSVKFCPFQPLGPDNSVYYTLYSLSDFSLAKSLQLILEISVTYRLVSYLRLICRLRTQCMISYDNIKSGSLRARVCRYFNFFKTMYNKTIIRFSFCDILSNQGLGKCYQPSRRRLGWQHLPRPWLFRIPQKPHPLIVYNHNYNKIHKSDWLSTVLISTLIGQCNRTVHIMPKW